MPFSWTVIMRFAQWSLSGCKGCTVVFLFINCGKHPLRRMRSHVKQMHTCHDCMWLLLCNYDLKRCARLTYDRPHHRKCCSQTAFLLRTISTSALSSRRIVSVSVVCLHASALIHNCRCQCVLCMITAGSRRAFVSRYFVSFLVEGIGTHVIKIKTKTFLSAHFRLYLQGLAEGVLVLS